MEKWNRSHFLSMNREEKRLKKTGELKAREKLADAGD